MTNSVPLQHCPQVLVSIVMSFVNSDDWHSFIRCATIFAKDRFNIPPGTVSCHHSISLPMKDSSFWSLRPMKLDLGYIADVDAIHIQLISSMTSVRNIRMKELHPLLIFPQLRELELWESANLDKLSALTELAALTIGLPVNGDITRIMLPKSLTSLTCTTVMMTTITMVRVPKNNIISQIIQLNQLRILHCEVMSLNSDNFISLANHCGLILRELIIGEFLGPLPLVITLPLLEKFHIMYHDTTTPAALTMLRTPKLQSIKYHPYQKCISYTQAIVSMGMATLPELILSFDSHEVVDWVSLRLSWNILLKNSLRQLKLLGGIHCWRDLRNAIADLVVLENIHLQCNVTGYNLHSDKTDHHRLHDITSLSVRYSMTDPLFSTLFSTRN